MLPYLADLGVSHIYASPYLQAAPGSTHGYDVASHSQLNPELGGQAGHSRFCAALGAAGLGQILDIVPNHMWIGGPENRWWWSVLEAGPASPYARYFDVDWNPPETKLRNVVLMPILGDHYGRVLERGEMRLEMVGDRFRVRHFDHVLPLSPQSVGILLEAASHRSGSDQLAYLAHAFQALPESELPDRQEIWQRQRDASVLYDFLSRHRDEEPGVSAAIESVLEEVNGDPARLHDILERQNYRLASWRTAGRELDYRRFFDVNTLAALRIEDDQVFEDTHRLIGSWLRDGVLDGVRVDHPDGLRDPQHYFDRLRAASPRAWIVVEKILEVGERLPQSWPVAGTTGYDLMNLTSGLFVDRGAEQAMTRLYEEITGDDSSYEDVVLRCKKLVLEELLGSDLSRLTALLSQACESDPRYRDYTRHELREALGEVIAGFPVYRTYVRATSWSVSEDDERHVDQAVGAARSRRPDLDTDLWSFLRDILLLRHRGPFQDELAERFQQTTGPVMAKGVEDTAFYRYNRLVALNEVGGDPGRFGTTLEEFHVACAERQRLWPGGMASTSTHDTKRSEDVRVRIALLSQDHERWSDAVRRWHRRNARHRSGHLPDPNTEYLLYQTLVGAHPIDAARAAAYMEKATKEAKAGTSWIDPKPAFDAALRRFTESLLADGEFMAELDAFIRPLLDPWMGAALAQKLIALTASGVPDVYQGTEIWDLSLVDPDNRRPVDYAARRRLLAELAGLGAEEAWARRAEGLPKLLLVQRALRLRRERPRAFAGTYRPLALTGAQARRGLAFARGEEVVVVAPTMTVGLVDWGDTRVALPTGSWRDELSGREAGSGEAALADLLKPLPVALLARS